jgi:hypothetical protein
MLLFPPHMKNLPRLIAAAVGSSLVASTLHAVTGQSHAAIPHQHPKYTSVSTNYHLFDDQGDLDVTWTARDDGTPNVDNIIYTVTIVKAKDGDPRTYSLLTLGLQTTRHSVKIVSAAVGSGDVKYAVPPGDAVLKPLTAGQVIPPAVGPGGKLDIDKIAFINFSAKVCILEVAAVGRDVVGQTQWQPKGTGPTKEGHDNTPPGGTSGN